MQELQDLIRQVVSDRDLTPEQVPALDLYMDQVLTLFNDGCATASVTRKISRGSKR